MHTGCPAYPLARQGLAASPLRPPVAREPLRPWRGATPGAQVPGSGAGPCAFSHARPRPLRGSLPMESSLQEGRSAPLPSGGSPVRRPAGRRAVGHGRASARDALVPPRLWPSRMGLLVRERPHGRVGWPCTSQPSPCRVRHAEHMGRSRQRAHAPDRHRPPRRLRHKRNEASNLRLRQRVTSERGSRAQRP